MKTTRQDLQFDCLVHDLNNVFQTIIDAAELMSSDPAWAPVSAILMRSVDHGRRIVSGLAEADRGIAALELLVDHAVHFAQDFSEASKHPAIFFLTDIQPGLLLDPQVCALERVLINLFINASQAALAAGRGQCRITVSARQQEQQIKIVVADDGPGIPEELLPAVFAPRFSTSPARTGLGLHIVRTLLDDAGGAVEAANAPAGGAVFTIHLPAARAGNAISRAAGAS